MLPRLVHGQLWDMSRSGAPQGLPPCLCQLGVGLWGLAVQGSRLDWGPQHHVGFRIKHLLFSGEGDREGNWAGSRLGSRNLHAMDTFPT